MCKFDEDAKILQAKEPSKKSKRPSLPPITKPEAIPKSSNELGKYLVVANQSALRLNQNDLKGEKKEQDPIYASARVYTAYNRRHLVDGIKQDCEAEGMVPLVKKCQDIWSSSLYYLFSVHSDFCDLGIQYVMSVIFDKCLKAQAQRTGKPKKSVEFVIKKAEVRIPNQVKSQEEFEKYAGGEYKDLLYAKQLTCPMILSKPIKQLVKNCYSDIRKVLGHSMTFAPMRWNWQQEMPPSEWGQHMRAHMGYIAQTNLTIMKGLISPFKALKLHNVDGSKFDGRRYMNTSLLLRMIGVGPTDASGANVELVISVCPIHSGKFTGSTHIVHTDDRKGSICRDKVLQTDGPRVTVVRSIRLSPITWLTAVCEHLFKLDDVSL